MSGQTKFSVSVQSADFEVGVELDRLRTAAEEAAADHEGNEGETAASVGAIASFVGHVRSRAGDESIAALELEHYPGMTEKSLTDILARAAERWPLAGGRVIHRYGRLEAGAQIVLVAIASAHRGDAFAACEFVMDFLKTEAPFWKKEEGSSGARWVDARDSDQTAAARWQV